VLSCYDFGRGGNRMDIVTPHQIVFETNEPVPIAEIVASLLGAEQLFRDVAPLLEAIFPGFRVERINVSVRVISQESPLRELFVVGVIATFQKDLEKDVPTVIEHLSGAHIPDEYRTNRTPRPRYRSRETGLGGCCSQGR
jgi:hypothetical protein